MSWMNEDYARQNGFIRVENGHFVNNNGRVKFFGVNLSRGGCFPDYNDPEIGDVADQVAKRLAKMGVNLIRLHHMDREYARQGIWLETGDPPNQRTIDPDQLEKLDYLIYQFKLNGIFCQMHFESYPS